MSVNLAHFSSVDDLVDVDADEIGAGAVAGFDAEG